jgi:hypothetical protein
MSRITRFSMVMNSTPDSFVNEVEQNMAMGWQPWGETHYPKLGAEYYAQTMVKYYSIFDDVDLTQAKQ